MKQTLCCYAIILLVFAVIAACIPGCSYPKVRSADSGNHGPFQTAEASIRWAQ